MTTKATEILNIYQRIAKVMQDISYVQKEDKKVNNQYTFVSHDAVTAALRPSFIKHGIVTVPRVTNVQMDGNRTTVFIEVDFVNIDTPDDRITVPVFGYGIDPQDKGPGKAMSYAVKYAYLKVFALETGDDPERDNIPHEPAPVLKLNAEQEQRVSSFIDLIKAASTTNDLQAIFSDAWLFARNLPDAVRNTFIEVKDARKSQLLKGV
jgi:hypothetical protein